MGHYEWANYRVDDYNHICQSFRRWRGYMAIRRVPVEVLIKSKKNSNNLIPGLIPLNGACSNI